MEPYVTPNLFNATYLAFCLGYEGITTFDRMNQGKLQKYFQFPYQEEECLSILLSMPLEFVEFFRMYKKLKNLL